MSAIYTVIVLFVAILLFLAAILWQAMKTCEYTKSVAEHVRWIGNDIHLVTQKSRGDYDPSYKNPPPDHPNSL